MGKICKIGLEQGKSMFEQIKEGQVELGAVREGKSG